MENPQNTPQEIKKDSPDLLDLGWTGLPKTTGSSEKQVKTPETIESVRIGAVESLGDDLEMEKEKGRITQEDYEKEKQVLDAMKSAKDTTGVLKEFLEQGKINQGMFMRLGREYGIAVAVEAVVNQQEKVSQATVTEQVSEPEQVKSKKQKKQEKKKRAEEIVVVGVTDSIKNLPKDRKIPLMESTIPIFEAFLKNQKDAFPALNELRKGQTNEGFDEFLKDFLTVSVDANKEKDEEKRGKLLEEFFKKRNMEGAVTKEVLEMQNVMHKMQGVIENPLATPEEVAQAQEVIKQAEARSMSTKDIVAGIGAVGIGLGFLLTIGILKVFQLSIATAEWLMKKTDPYLPK